MAIVQISKIIHRTGANVDLPQLDTGEIGFSTDEQKLFIGNDPILYPVPNGQATTQLEILTEVSNLDFAKVTGSSNTELQITSPRVGQLIVADGSSNTMIADRFVNWSGNLLGNGVAHSNNKLHLGNVANIEITGGMNGGVLSTDGAGNLYWTTVSGGGGGDGLPAQNNNSGKYLKTNGTVATWENVFTDTHFATTVRSNISVGYNSGYGNLSYSSSTGVITFTGPSVADIRGRFSAGTGVSYDGANGEFSIGQDISATSSPTFDTLNVANINISGLYKDDGQSPTPTVLNGIVFNNSSNTLATSDEFYYQNHILHVGSIKTDGGMIEAGTLFKAPLTTKAPTDSGTPGQICWDTDYLYICTYTDNWEKIEIGSTVSGGGSSYGDSDVGTYLTTNGYVTGSPWTTEGYLTSSDLSGYALSSSIPTDIANLSDATNLLVPTPAGSNTEVQFNIDGAFSSSSKLIFDPSYGGGMLRAPYIHANGLAGLEVTNNANIYGNASVLGNVTVQGDVMTPNLDLKWNGGANTFRIFANVDGVFLEDTSDNTFFKFTLTAVP